MLVPFDAWQKSLDLECPQRVLYPQLDASSLGLWDLVKLWGVELNGRSPGHCKASPWRGSRIAAPLLSSYSLVGNEMRDFPLPFVSTIMNQRGYKDKGTYWSWTGISKLPSQISLFSSRLAVSGMCCNDGKLANMCGFFLYLLPLSRLAVGEGRHQQQLRLCSYSSQFYFLRMEFA